VEKCILPTVIVIDGKNHHNIYELFSFINITKLSMVSGDMFAWLSKGL